MIARTEPIIAETFAYQITAKAYVLKLPELKSWSLYKIEYGLNSSDSSGLQE